MGIESSASDKFVRISVVFLGCFAFLIFLYLAKIILLPIVLSSFLALVIYPLVKRLEKIRVPSALAIAISLLCVLLIGLTVLFFFATQFYTFSSEFSELSKALIARISGWMSFLDNSSSGEGGTWMEWFQNSFSGASDGVGEAISGVVGAATMILANLVLVPILAFFILLYRSQLKAFFYSIMKRESKEEVDGILQRIRTVVKNYVTGVATVVLCVAVIDSTGLWIAGVNYPILFGVFASVFAVIPYVGLLIGASPPLLWAIASFEDPWIHVLGIGLVFATSQIIESNLLTPRIVGGKVKVNPLAAIIALMTGAVVWGIAGMVVFLPSVAVLKVIFDSFETTKPIAILLGTDDEKEKS